jgi:hypothetical protein
MAVLFVSHSSKDDAALTALEAWLRTNGFTDIFIDHKNIAGGDKWREELRKSASACRVVICLVTENWLASEQCFGEFVAGNYIMGKRIIPLFWLPAVQNLGDAEKTRLAKVSAEDQGLKLNSCVTANGTLTRTSRGASRSDCALPALSVALVWTPKLSRSIATCVRCRFPASLRLPTRTRTPHCFTAAAARSRRRSKRCGRCVPPLNASPL